jgi:PAP2 superfamily
MSVDRDTNVARPRWYLEVVVLAACYGGYERLRAMDPSRPNAAVDHARSIVGVERASGLNAELKLNRTFAHHAWLGAFSAYYYDAAHLLIVGLVLLWLYAKRPSIYLHWRRILVLASMLASVIFWVYPVAPPRLALSGAADVVAQHSVFGSHTGSNGGFVNADAAMPSMHVGWAVWAAAAVAAGVTWSRWSRLVWLHPILTALVVVGTANHFLLDALAGTAIMLVAIALVRTTATVPGRDGPRESTLGSLATRPSARPVRDAA